MVDHIHILPLGFDAERLSKPLSSGIVSADKVILIRDEHDPKGNQGDSPHEELLGDTYERIREDLNEDSDVEVKEERLPLFSEVADVFQLFYRFIDKHASDDQISFNLSAAPKSTALAIELARSTWISEHPDRANAIQLYYFKPNRYLEAEVRKQLQTMVMRVDDLAHERNSFRSGAEANLADALTQPVQDALKRVKENRGQVELYIEDKVSDASGSNERNPVKRVTDAVEEVTSTVGDFINGPKDTNEHLNELGEYLTQAMDLGTDVEADPRQNVKAFRKQYKRRITKHEVPDRQAEPLLEAIDDLEKRVQTMVGARNALRSQFESLHQEITQIEQSANRADDLLETISQTGMTAGIRGSTDDWNVPLPPTANLREVEKVIVYILASQGDQRSIEALSYAIAQEIRELGEEIGAHPADVKMGKTVKNYCVRMEASEALGNTFEEFVADQFQTHLKYNLQSLSDKCYINHQECEKGSIKISLSASGELWASIHEFSEIRRTSLQETLQEQLEEYAESV